MKRIIIITAATFALWAVTHWGDYTAPPAAPADRSTRSAPAVTPARPIETAAPVTTSAPKPAVIQPPERQYDKRLNDRVMRFYRNRFNGTSSSGYNTGGRQTTLESDQGGAATREFSQQDGVTFLDGNTFTTKGFQLKKFDPTVKP